MILDLPQELEAIISQTAKTQGISAQELALATLQKSFAQDDEQAYYDWFCEHFDIDRMKEAIGETDENGRAKSTLTLPKGLNKEQLSAWLSENIPAHLEKRELA